MIMTHKIKIQSIAGLFVGLILIGCGGKEDEPVPVPIPVLGTTTLSLPVNNTACLQGTSANSTTASVSFAWRSSTNAASYQLMIKNLNTQTFDTYTIKDTLYTASLAINTPYSWTITATNVSGKTTSDSWKFYLSGAASSSYAPFAADLTAPASGATIASNGAASVLVTFQWTGSDPDNDIVSYSLYLGNTTAATQVIASQTASTATQTLTSGKTYYWKVVTTDKVGNTSVSTINSFKIN
jgi:hypothetical protein